ncbi:hypothetical protein GC170_17000 [bacterium]|nr:hypothetical protein [bacterium]
MAFERKSPRPKITAFQLFLILPALITTGSGTSFASPGEEIRIEVVADRGQDIGQAFGSLFEATSTDGSMTISAGFANGYGTRYRSDRHELAFYVRPRNLDRPIQVERLPRPNDLCGTYLFSRDGEVYSTHGGLKKWDERGKAWVDNPGPGGTHESMRVGNGILSFGDSTVTFDGQTILPPPTRGSYQLFYYANGFLCFYHIDRGAGGYRPFTSDKNGYSKLYACPWKPGEPAVDLTRAIVMTLPVVGETTFAWGVRDGQIVTGSNIGGFYVFEDGRWRTMLEPNLKVSYQLYSSMAFGDRLIMGQYPTGRIFSFDGRSIVDQPGWPPVPKGVSTAAREAQSTAIYGGEIFAGVWPWGELWRYRQTADEWRLVRRMFDHPEPSAAIVHPYDTENQGDSVPNQWGQRVTSLVTSGGSLFVATSAKDPCVWDEKRAPFLAPEKWKSYGSVYRLTMPGHLSATAAWTDGPTKLTFVISGETMKIYQDGRELGSGTLAGIPVSTSFANERAHWGKGIYGRFAGPKITGEFTRP